MLRVGVTGATGFVGRYLLRRLPDLGPFTVRALARTLPDTNQLPHYRIEWVQGDLNVPTDCLDFLRGLEVVVHLAHTNSPITSDKHLSGDAQANLLPTLNLIEAARSLGTRPHVVYASSGGAVYAQRAEPRPFREDDPCIPTSSYGIQKITAELYLRLAADSGWLSAISLRIGNAYGVLLPTERKQGFIGVAVNRVLRNEPVRILGNPHNVRDYVHLEDLSQAFALAIERPQHNGTFNIGSGTGLSVLDVIRTVESILGRPLQLEFAESNTFADRLVPWSVLDISRAHRELGWTPRIPFARGLRSLLHHEP